MFKNYFKSAIRFLRQNKIFAVINAVGLSIALAVSFIFLLYIINEYSYDRCHKNNKRIFRVLNYYVDYKQNSSQTPFALFLMWLILPLASRLLQITLPIIISNIVTYLLIYLILTLFVGIGSGIYTSVYLSRQKVIDVLKNIIQSGKKKSVTRSFLIVFQLIVFCSFASSALIIRSQYHYALKRDPGYYNKNILLIDIGRDFKGYSAFINELKSNPNVIMAGGTISGLPMEGVALGIFPHYLDKDVDVEMEILAVDYNFLETMGLKLTNGRFFSKEFGSDMTQSVILNETAVRRLGITDPIGRIYGDRSIIGIVNDFNLHSIHSDIPALYIIMTDKYIRQVAVHYKQGSLNNILPTIESLLEKTAPDSKSFSYTTIEELIKTLYSSEKSLSTVVLVFALFTMLIAALGLFGLTIFLTRTRIKEIGIKKVFGCPEKSIVFSFLRGNIILVFLSTLFSTPLTIFFMNKWLNTFPFRTDINWWIFVIVFLVAAIVVLLTVFFHSYRASHNNPVNALKYE